MKGILGSGVDEGRACPSDGLVGVQLVFSKDQAEWCRNTASYPQIKINALFYCRDVLFDYFRCEMRECFQPSGGVDSYRLAGICARRCGRSGRDSALKNPFDAIQHF